MLVLDATPLIYLATVGRLALLDEPGAACVIPRPVHAVVVTAGVDAGHPDARRVQRAVDAGTCFVRDPPETDLADRLRENPNLSEADVAVIALAVAEGGTAVMDERYGRAVADTEGVETQGTITILGTAVQADQLTGTEAMDIVEEMIEAGWYCSTALYTRIRHRFREFDRHA